MTRGVAAIMACGGLAGLLGSAPVVTQARPPAVSSISGVIVADEADARPLRRVTLTLAGGELAAGRIALSDDLGRFTFGHLPAGRYTVTARRAGYVQAAYGTRRGWRSPGVPIALGEGEQRVGLTVWMMRGAVITGSIRDQSGRPTPNVRIRTGQLRTTNGMSTLIQASTRAIVTDDRGIYRVYGLPPGTFVVAAEYRPTWNRIAIETGQEEAPHVGYVPIYYPGTADAAAAVTVSLEAGEERSGVDFVVRPVPMAEVSGVVHGVDRVPASRVRVTVYPIDAVAGAGQVLTSSAITNQQGEFTITRVPPGRYALMAIGGSAAAVVWAQTMLRVDGRPAAGMELSLQTALRVSGQVVFDVTGPPPTGIDRTRVRLRPWPGPSPIAMLGSRPVAIAEDGTFRFEGVVPGSYVLSVLHPAMTSGPTMMVESASLGSVDLLANTLDVSTGGVTGALEITVTDRVTVISGRLIDQTDAPAPEFLVLVYPADPDIWTLGPERLPDPVRPATDGRYAVGGLPPGDYLLAALTDIGPGDHLDPEFLRLLVPSSIPITLGVGEQKVQDVRVVR